MREMEKSEINDRRNKKREENRNRSEISEDQLEDK